jgi:predicted enzyme related to lactoylglutathione lyase
MPEHFGFTKLVVHDLERSFAFYRDVFGLAETARVSADIAGRPIDEIMLRPTAPGGANLVLLSYPDRPAPSSDEVILGFVTGDLAAVVERATTHGGSVLQPPREMPEHGIRVAFITDVEGHLVEVVEMLARP